MIIAIIVVILLLAAGGATTAVLLLLNKPDGSFNLGSASVIGANIKFKNMRLKQNGSSLVLTGAYTNSSKKKGDVMVTVQGISNGNERLISFTVPISTSGGSFTQRKTSTVKLSGATLGPLLFESSSSSSDDGDTSPWNSPSDSGIDTSPDGSDEEPTSPDTSPSESSSPSKSTSPSTVPESSDTAPSI